MTQIPDAYTVQEIAQRGLTAQQLPSHVGVIMDGNGRWAEADGKDRSEGHAKGAEVVDWMVEECSRFGVEQLTLYCLSTENIAQRPEKELDCLMALLLDFLRTKREKLVRNGQRFSVIGRRDRLSPEVLEEIDRTSRDTESNTGLRLCLAINYGGWAEVVDANRSIGRLIEAGKVTAADIDEQMVKDHLYTAGMPDPDLIIRTAGEHRTSNFLPLQAAYSEWHFTETLWPNFSMTDLVKAFADFGRRQRRFGATTPRAA